MQVTVAAHRVGPSGDVKKRLSRVQPSRRLQTAAPSCAARGRGEVRCASTASDGADAVSSTSSGEQAGGLQAWFSNLVKANDAGATAQAEIASLLPELSAEQEKAQRWDQWWILPLEPFSNRKTICTEVVPGVMWSFEQLLGAIQINVNQRMTVIKLQSGGLWVHSPVAPTAELLATLDQLCELHGPVKYIVNPTYAVEHKVFVGALANRYPQAEVWVCPGQYSYPLNLPVNWQLGLPMRKVHTIDVDGPCPWEDEIEHQTLGPLKLQVGCFVETVFFHRRSKSLLVTDLVVHVPRDPPAVCLDNPAALLFESRDNPMEQIKNTKKTREKGWWKTVLLALYIKPTVLDLNDNGFQWVDGWKNSFESVCGRNTVFPLLRLLILNRYPEEVLEWRDAVARWSFKQVVPAHFAGPAPCSPREFREAFAFLEESNPTAAPAATRLPRALTQLFGRSASALDVRAADPVDLEFLQSVNTFATDKGLVPPPRQLGQS